MIAMVLLKEGCLVLWFSPKVRGIRTKGTGGSLVPGGGERKASRLKEMSLGVVMSFHLLLKGRVVLFKLEALPIR